jgi:excisionase family DNA binding protein
MKLHLLPSDTRCPCCGQPGLTFVRRRFQGDLYRCAAETPCNARTLHHCGTNGRCGVSAEANGHLLFWTECAGQEPATVREPAEEYLTTRQVAARLQISRGMVSHLVATGKMSAVKVGGQWQVSLVSLRNYTKTATVKMRAARAVYGGHSDQTAAGRSRITAGYETLRRTENAAVSDRS